MVALEDLEVDQYIIFHYNIIPEDYLALYFLEVIQLPSGFWEYRLDPFLLPVKHRLFWDLDPKNMWPSLQ